MRKSILLLQIGVLLSGLICGGAALAFTSLDDNSWNETAVRRVLHTFAYGGFATDTQITSWSVMAPDEAIQEMLTFDAVNDLLSPIEDTTADYAETLEELQILWSSDDPDNLTCVSKRSNYNETNTRADDNVVLRNQGLQNTWIQAVHKRGLNPFRHKVGFWLVNYQMAVNLHDTEPPLIQDLYDSSVNALEQGAPFHEMLAIGATSAAVAREYGHRTNIYNNNTGVFRGNDDFAREFHQLFFRINGDIEDPDYHENTTIEHTARALTGMQIDKDPDAYGTTLAQDWWVAPINFTDHFDADGRNIRNFTRHHAADLEILHQPIGGATARDKLFGLAAVAITHPESLDNLPVSIINFFADDNLTDAKMTAIRQAWSVLAGTPDDLIHFLQAYAISEAFHSSDRFKYRTAFHRNMTVYNLNTVDNEEAYGNSFSPRSMMAGQGAEVFIPVHDVFGGQTSLNAANNPNLFKEAYNSSVESPNRVAKTVETCRDDAGTNLGTWRKDWAQMIPTTDGGYPVKQVGQWLWERFISDNRTNYGTLERAQVTALLATGMDFGYQVDPNNPDIAYSAQQLQQEPLVLTVTANEAELMNLDSGVTATRREANRRVGMAINFITMTPFMFASQGAQVITVPPILAPDVVGLAELDATAAIVAANLTLGATMTESSDTVPNGDVISQNPIAGSSMVSGDAVDLVVSSGPALVTVPDVSGMTQAAAETAITNVGLTTGAVTTQNSDTVTSGDVISQNPAANLQVALGSTVNLLVSSGPALVTVPDVGGMTQAAAEAAIANVGLTTGAVTTQSSDTVTSGDVISQNPAANLQVVPGSAVDLLVSSGAAQVPPAPHIQANGSDGTLAIAVGSQLNVSISLDPGSHIGTNADWWISMYYFDAGSGSWQAFYSTGFQAPLADLGPTALIDTAGFPAGYYYFLYGVDLIPNGVFDLDQFSSDSVTVIVQ